MPRNPRRVAFNFQKRAKKRATRPNVYTGPVPGESPAEGESPAADAPARSESRNVRRVPGRGRNRGVVYTEYIRQELIKFGAIAGVMIAVVIVAAVLID